MRMIAAVSAEGIEPHSTIRTTLYDLIEAINTEVGPEEEHLVVATLAHLLGSGRLTFLGGLEHNN